MTNGRRVRGWSADPGQASVEAALLVPFIVFALLAVAQIGVVVHSRVMVSHAAREGARVAAVGGSDDEIRRAVAVAGDLPLHRLTVDVHRSGGAATVTVHYLDPTSVPIVGSLLDDVELSALARMRLE